MEENKKSNTLLIVLIVILLIISIGSVTFIIINKDKLFANEDSKPTEEKEESQKLESFDLSKFDNTRVINKNEGIEYANDAKEVSNLIPDSTGEYIKLELQSDSKTVVAKINWGRLTSSNINANTNDYTYTLSLNKKIRKVYVNGWGQSIGAETIFYLMEDGTIEYTPVSGEITNEYVNKPDSFKLKSYGKVPGVDGVVMIAGVTAQPVNTNIGGYWTLLGIKSDGTFYDLQHILDEDF